MKRPFLTVICLSLSLLSLCGCGDGELVRPQPFASVIETLPADTADVPADLLRAARGNHIPLLERALKKYDETGIKGYTCRLRKQERIKGKMKKQQVVRVTFMEDPYSLAMHWEKNPPLGDALLYVEGMYTDKKGRSLMLVRPHSGVLKFLTGGSVLKLPDCKEAMQNTLKPCTQFGVRNGLELLLKYYRIAEKNGHLKMGCGGVTAVGGRKCIVLVREIPEKSVTAEIDGETREIEYPAKISETCLDFETLLPLRIVGYDWNNRLFCTYEFLDVELNPGLEPKDFTPAAVGINPPKK